MDITPQTKVGALLDAHPELEAVLLELSPAFAKLKNPVLRRTVAKLATLETAAGMAGLKPRDLVVALRRALGQPVDEGGEDATLPDEPAPAWVQEGQVRTTIEADALLAKGESPLSAVLAQARLLQAGELLLIAVSFKPVPLIETLEKQGYRTCLQQVEAGHFALLVAPAAG
ncbi:MAG: DUF1858 domain-containing protein [Candidatus Latescibacteria bacterium]|nr:DUF1858 domain-containing protein [Candidatus Latescibacterota bacterium]